MNQELEILRQRVERLEAAVGAVRDRLRHCLDVAARPQDAMTLARSVAETMTKDVLEKLGYKKPPPMLDACLKELEKPEVMSRGLVPAEIITLLHMVRVMGNKATHDAMRIEPTASDVDLVLRSVLRVVEWYFAEFERGPKVNPLFTGGVAPPPFKTDDPPPAVRMPPLTITKATPSGETRKIFIFTERLIGLGRQKTSRDPRVRIVTRMLPCPDQSHPNWNKNLQNISQFHAQLWWEMGRVEIRDESSDKGVLIDDRRIAPGVWALCSFADPARVCLGPQGVEFAVSEIHRNVDGIQVPCVSLRRIGNWPFHEYLLVSRPLITIGSDTGCIAWFADVPDLIARVISTEQGWTLRLPDGVEKVIDPAAPLEIPNTGLSVKRATEEDFLS